MVATIETASQLSAARRRLLETISKLNFGRIENLVIQNGQPVFDPPPSILRDVKFGAENGPHAKSALSDFSLKSRLLDLFSQLDALESGVVRSLEVKHGLPFSMIVEERAA